MFTLSIYPKGRKLFKNQRVTLVKASKILNHQNQDQPILSLLFHKIFFKKKSSLFSSTKTRIPFSLNPKSENREGNSMWMFHRAKILRREKFHRKR